MKRSEEEWLDRKIDEELMAMADEREKLLMESEELQDIDMPMEKLEDIHRELERRTRRKKSGGRIRLRVILVAAAIMVLFVGVGMVSSGKKLYIPVIFQKDRGSEISTKVENSESVYSEYDEEEVCREIEEKLGVIPVRFGYQPKGMKITKYILDEDVHYALTSYQCGENSVQVYVSKDYQESTINYQTDGDAVGTLIIESLGMEIPAYQYEDSEGQMYYQVSFEILNTYYFITGMMEQDQFIELIKNILLKNA